MTLKNLLTTTEKTIQISNFRIVSRLRCVICILISFICISSAQDNCFAQQFVQERIAGYYHDKKFLDISSDHAYLLYDYSPSGAISHATIVSSADIKTLVDFNYYNRTGVFGIYRDVSVDGVSHRICLSVITPSKIIFESSSGVGDLLPQIQQFLIQKNLGTVSQRRSFIGLSKSDFDIEPVNFASNLGRWLLIGIVIAIAIPPLWWIVKRFLK